jgi:tryptophan-rich sensory protein
LATGATVALSAAAAAAGSAGARTGTVWYHTLDKPPWQPPPQAFPVVWTPLYVAVAYGTGRLTASHPRHGRVLALTAADLAANAAWTWAFFDRRSPGAGLAVLGVLDLLNARLLGEALRCDERAAVALAPYVAWCGFATLLNADILVRNWQGRLHFPR